MNAPESENAPVLIRVKSVLNPHKARGIDHRRNPANIPVSNENHSGEWATMTSTMVTAEKPRPKACISAAVGCDGPIPPPAPPIPPIPIANACALLLPVNRLDVDQ